MNDFIRRCSLCIRVSRSIVARLALVHATLAVQVVRNQQPLLLYLDSEPRNKHENSIESVENSH